MQTGSIEVQWDMDKIDVFEAAQTFSVVTSDLVDPPDLDEEQMVFNDTVNRLIIEAMQAEPVCLELVPADEAEANPPDLWAANGIARTTEGGYYYQCVGGWVWGFFGWYWDSCAYWRPTYVEWDVGSLLIPVLPPPAEGEEPEPIFQRPRAVRRGDRHRPRNQGPRRRAGDLRAVAGSAKLPAALSSGSGGVGVCDGAAWLGRRGRAW